MTEPTASSSEVVVVDAFTADYWFDRASIGDRDQCWPWLGNISPRGYGFARGTTAHRWTWELFFGPLPKDQVVCHRCDNPPCVNPFHLWADTQSANMRDAANKQRLGRQWATHCRNGHEYTPENTYMYRGNRQCNKCRSAHSSAQWRRKKAARSL